MYYGEKEQNISRMKYIEYLTSEAFSNLIGELKVQTFCTVLAFAAPDPCGLGSSL